MEIANEQQTKINERESERGAALVMVLLISFLLLGAVGGLLFAASMHTANITDAVAEEQAYNTAESGIQTAINVLRRNSAPDPLLDPSKPASDPSNQITYRRAVQIATSNTQGDSPNAARLSRWIRGYNTAGFNVTVSDPDNGNNITYYTNGKINGLITEYQIGNGNHKVIIDFEEATSTSINVSSGAGSISLGNFKVQVSGDGATLTRDIRFSITFKMTAPYSGSRTIRGFIKAGTINNTSNRTVRIDFDSNVYELSGSRITLANDPLEITIPANSTSPISGAVNASITQGEPRRLLIRSTGLGPRGAEKQLEAIILKDLFDGLYAPATITMVGAQSGFYFDAGNSAAFTYSGQDLSSGMMVPPVGVAVPGLNVDAFATYMASLNANIVGYPADVTDELPDWLGSPQQLDATVNQLRDISKYSGGYYPAGQTPTSFGNNATGQGITFVDGNVSLSGAGGGILVCTGTLTLEGDFDFRGLIIVTGPGGVIRDGSGNGNVYGNLVVSPYSKTTTNGTTTYTSLGPKYNMQGGGTSTTRFDSNSVFNGLLALDNIVVGVAEK